MMIIIYILCIIVAGNSVCKVPKMVSGIPYWNFIKNFISDSFYYINREIKVNSRGNNNFISQFIC